MPTFAAPSLPFLDRLTPLIEVSDLEYRLVGTAAAMLHGVNLPVGDVDILVRRRPAIDRVHRALAQVRCLVAPEYVPSARQYFAEYDVEGVRVGFSTVEWEAESDAIECIGLAG